MNTRIQSIERKKKVAEYIHAHNGRVSIMALAAELGCHYSTAAHYISELQAEGMEVQLEGRIRNPRESVLAYVKSHPEKYRSWRPPMSSTAAMRLSGNISGFSSRKAWTLRF